MPQQPLISQIEIYQSKIKLKEPFVISLGTLHHAANIIVVIKTNTGITGFGECSPFMTIHGESMETCFVVGGYLARALKKKNPFDIVACTSLMDSVIYNNSSIKSAFDMALYDIAAQHAGLPLYAYLGGKNNKKLLTDYTVSLGEKDKMAADAATIKANGFSAIKVKLGGTKEEDLERIRAIRNKVGLKIPIRIDANQGWNLQTAKELLKELKPYQIQHCEEPIPRWDFMNLHKLNKHSPIPIMADESCCDHHDAARLLKLKACSRFNIKLGKSGGIYKALKITALAEKEKMKMQMGGFLESRLGFTAAAHVALTSKYICYFDFDTPLMFETDVVKGGITYSKGGRIQMPDGNGLGASVDGKFLAGCKHKIF